MALPTIDQVLLANAQKTAQENTDYGKQALVGAALGATGGLTMGDLAARLNPNPKIGTRFAGGLVGAILGGALGPVAKAAMSEGNPSADLLAKLQVNGDLNAPDTHKLQQLLADSYNSTLAM